MIMALLISSAQVTAETETDEKKTKPISITKLIPGIEQIKSGKYAKGTLLLSSFIGSITGAVIYNKKGSDWYDKYKNSTNVEDIIIFRQNTEKNLKKRNLFLVGIASIWVIHIIDLKFFKSKKGGVTGEVGKNTINIGFHYHF